MVLSLFGFPIWSLLKLWLSVQSWKSHQPFVFYSIGGVVPRFSSRFLGLVKVGVATIEADLQTFLALFHYGYALHWSEILRLASWSALECLLSPSYDAFIAIDLQLGPTLLSLYREKY